MKLREGNTITKKEFMEVKEEKCICGKPIKDLLMGEDDFSAVGYCGNMNCGIKLEAGYSATFEI